MERFLDPAEAVVDGPPARLDQVDEQTEVVDARVALGEQLGLDPLEPADGLIGEPAYLGELTRDRTGLGADPVADGLADAVRERRLELRGGGRERLDLGAGPFERGVDVGGLGLSLGGFVEPFAGTLEGVLIHEADDSVFGG